MSSTLVPGNAVPSHEVGDFRWQNSYDQLIAAFDSGETSTLAEEALEQLVLASAPIRAHVAQRFMPAPRLAFTDFMQSGVEGVYVALSRADTSSSPRQFSVFTMAKVFSAMYEHAALAGGAITVSEGGLKRIVKVKRILQGVQDGYDLQDLLDEFDLSATLFETYSKVSNLFGAQSFDRWVGDATKEDANFLTSGEPNDEIDVSSDPQDIIVLLEKRDKVQAALNELPEKKRYVAERYFGFDGGDGVVLAQIAEELGVTESRICQIVTEIKRDLRPILEDVYYD